MNDFTFMILRIITTLIAMVVACYVVPLMKQAIAKYNDDKLFEFIRSAVYAAQQTIQDNFNKKQYVVERVTAWLKAHDIEITEEQLDLLIESTVLTMKMEIK
ncbi:MAG: phage holin [Lachnospiraceae bacterium]|nr:phage holin [Lachnospiraceae bacterium]